MTFIYNLKLGLQTRKINIKDKKFDESLLQIFNIVIISFLL